MHFHFSTVVWGPWHTQVFLDVNLPSLLTPNNLPAFAAQHQVSYRILTAEDDIPRIKASPGFQHASKIVPFELIPCSVEHPAGPIAMHHMLWRRSIDEARDAGAMILFVPPDVVWSNGALGHVADLATQGKKAIFMTYMRVVSETCVPEVRRRLTAADGVTIDASSRDLVELSLQYIHPLTLTYQRDSQNFPIHPEFILWRVPGEGFLMRVLVREMFAYDPARFDLNEQALLASAPDPKEVHYITDSDKLFALSLAPALKDLNWYSRRQKFDPLKVGSWWLTYDSPANDLVASHYFRIHRSDCTPEKWRRAEMESDIVINRLKGAREALRVLAAAPADRARHVRQILMLALSETKLALRLHRRVPFTVLLPRNADVVRWLCEEGEDLLKARPANGLVDLILDHVVIDRIVLKQGEPATLRTASGGTRQLTWMGGTALIDDVPVERQGFLLARDQRSRRESIGYLVERVLPRSRRD